MVTQLSADSGLKPKDLAPKLGLSSTPLPDGLCVCVISCSVDSNSLPLHGL